MRDKLLSLLLRLAGLSMLLAVVGAVMPRSWMAACHQWLGLGAFPEGAIVEYLARSLSVLYMVVGGLFWVVGDDVRRHAAVILYIGWAFTLAGLAALAITIAAGLPLYWILGESLSTLLTGVAVLLLRPTPQDNRS